MNTSTARPVRVGLIGYGIAGAVFHAPLIAGCPDTRLAAVVTGDPERRSRVHDTYPETEVVADVRELVARADEWDLIVVASPNSRHGEHVSAAIEADLPVVVDKPFTPTAREGRELVRRATERGVPLTVFQNRRWDNDFRTLQHLLDTGELGTVRRFESRFERWVPRPKPGWREQGAVSEAGGVLYDLGSHLIDQALRLFGPVDSVYAEMDLRRDGVEVDDDSFVALTHASGVRSHLWTSKVAPQHGPRLRVLGSEAAYTKFGLDPQEAALRAGGGPGQDGWGVEDERLWGVLSVGDQERTVPSLPGRYEAFYPAVVRGLREGAPMPVDPADSIEGLDVIEAARRSAQRAEVVPLG